MGQPQLVPNALATNDGNSFNTSPGSEAIGAPHSIRPTKIIRGE
jgi:hypothetical protein